jgi:hypothetical protein
MRYKLHTLLLRMMVIAAFCGILPGCTGADNPKIQNVPEADLKALSSKIEPNPTANIAGKAVDFSKKPKYMEAMGKRNKTGP